MFAFKENNMRNYVKTFHKSFPTFVSKYRGRSNGGIPCFSQERSRERELKVSDRGQGIASMKEMFNLTLDLILPVI